MTDPLDVPLAVPLVVPATEPLAVPFEDVIEPVRAASMILRLASA